MPDRQAIAARARNIVMAVERELGFQPVDREFERLGYDIESRDPRDGHGLRFIEVKGRAADAATITVTKNEILCSLTRPTALFWRSSSSTRTATIASATSADRSAVSQTSGPPVLTTTLPNSWNAPGHRRDLSHSSRSCKEEADRGRSAARRHQQGVVPREVHSPRASQHLAPLVGATPARDSTGRDLRADGGRPVRQPGPVPNRTDAGEGTPASLPHHRGPSQVGEHHQRTGLQRARDEIWQSWRRACADNADHPRANELFNRHVLPAFHDPFAGGGSLPLEAQRLGLEAHASDLNPVAVLINKAMIEIPPKFGGRPPVNPGTRGEKRLMCKAWRGAEGLAEDVRYYGQWMRDQAERLIGHLYPKVRITAEMARDRSDLAPYIGRDLTVIGWLWARTVKSPSPAFANVEVPWHRPLSFQGRKVKKHISSLLSTRTTTAFKLVSASQPREPEAEPSYLVGTFAA